MSRRGIISLTAAVAVLLGGFLLLSGMRPRPAAKEHIRYAVDLNRSVTNARSKVPELSRMDYVIDSFMQRWILQGMSLAVMRGDSLVYAKGYGWADVDKGRKMSPGTTMRMASVSKLLTAAGIMKLQDEGKLNILTPVFGPFGILNRLDKYIKDDNYYLITVEDLLRHEAGFTTRGGDPMFSTLSMTKSLGLSSPPDQETLAQALLARPLGYIPETDKAYSNFGYLLLSMIIEQVSGKPYAQFMQEEIFAPSGVKGFRIAGNWLKDRHPGEAHYYMQPDSEPCPAYDGSGDVVRCYGGNDITTLSGAGAWVGSTVELARLVATFNGCDGIPDQISKESFREMTVHIDDDSYGLGWNDCKADGELTRTGSFSGTSAIIKAFPGGECWILITNTSSWRGSRFSRNTGALIHNLRNRFSSSLPHVNLFLEEE